MEKRTYYLTICIPVSSALIALILLITAVIIVPKAVRLINTALPTLENMETVTEVLMEKGKEKSIGR